ncbi:hypothetical protein [Flavobacterium selenitireducens]|uniref:hypothetical protein n=1 Tax=Flavobacterium selenitireducens TaxID=2722704 RepID=UPI00168B8BEB|nr:hypothetical protein [Flavobacterium selenitireducens]MBD3583703.1 hypothetical protein [Flavobacterium selenitireducens]
MKNKSKIVTGFFAVVFAVSSLVSCSGDDSPSGTPVRYSLFTSSEMIQSITFRDRDGSMRTVALEAVNLEWGKTIRVEAPFAAAASVQFDNDSQATQTYTLKVFVDGELADSEEGTVSAGVTGAATVNANVTE